MAGPPEELPREAPTAEGDASAAPPLLARFLAFAAILLAGAAGGFIGYAFTDLQCQGDCGTSKGIGGMIGAVIAAVGVAVVAVLALRAMAEWRTIRRTGDTGNWRDARALRKEQAAGTADPAGPRPARPRVR